VPGIRRQAARKRADVRERLLLHFCVNPSDTACNLTEAVNSPYASTE